MNAYPLRSKQDEDPCAGGVVDLYCDVDLTVDSDDGSCSDDDVPNRRTPRLTTSADGCFQSLSTPLVASLMDKDMKVTVKWGISNKDEQQIVSSEKFHINEKIFAWDRGVLYEAKVRKCKDDQGGIFRYYVHYQGYKKGHDRWLFAHDMIKDTPSSRKYYCESRGLENGGDVQKKDDDAEEQQNVQPPEAVSSSRIDSALDEDEYAKLRERYLMPRVREKVELPGGRILRRQTKGRIIDQNTKGFRLLKSKVDTLLRKGDHSEVYRLLCQLKNWEMNPRRVPAAFQDVNRGDEDVAEVLDLTREEEEDGTGIGCIDVDHYITAVLLRGMEVEDNRKLSPLQTPSNSLLDITPSKEQFHRVSSDVESATTNNQSIADCLSDSGECRESKAGCVKQEKPNAIRCRKLRPLVKEQVVQITRAGMKELETYAYAVVDHVSKGAVINIPNSTRYFSTERSDDSSKTSLATVRSTLITPRTPALPQQESTQNFFERWEDMPKPPGQLTIDECRPFYVQTERERNRVMVPTPFCQYGLPAQHFSLFGQQNVPTYGFNVFAQQANLIPIPNLFQFSSTRNSFAPQHPHSTKSSHLAHTKDSELQQLQLSINCDFTNPKSIRDNFGYKRGKGKLQPMLSEIAKLKTNKEKAQYVRIWRTLTKENQERWKKSRKETRLKEKEQRKRKREELQAAKKVRMTCNAKREMKVFAYSVIHSVERQLHPQKVEKGACDPLTSGKLLIAGMVPPSPANRKKPPVARLVTPEVPSKMNSTKAQQKRHQRKKRRRKVNERIRKKLDFSSETKRLSVTDFGFPSGQMRPTVDYQGPPSFMRSRREGTLHKRSPGQYSSGKRQKRLQTSIHPPTFSIIPSSRIAMKSDNFNKSSLHEEWKKQTTKRKKGEWMPSGHLNGKWKPPKWASAKSQDVCPDGAKQKKPPSSCSKSLLPILDSLLSRFLVNMKIKCDSSGQPSPPQSLHDVVCPQYVKPTNILLQNAHSALRDLLPKGDCEDWEVVELARRYYNHWRPQETKVIILAESHAHTSKVSIDFIELLQLFHRANMQGIICG